MSVRFLVAAVLLCTAGCGETTPVNNKPSAPLDSQSSSPDTRPAAAAVSLEVLDAAGTDRLIASHKGKIVVVDLWTLW